MKNEEWRFTVPYRKTFKEVKIPKENVLGITYMTEA